MNRHLLSYLLAILCVSCSTTDEVIPAIAVSPEPFDPAVQYTTDKTRLVDGYSYSCTVFGIPVGNPSVEEAVRDAIMGEDENCVGLSDAVVNHYVDALLILVGNNAIHVSGYPMMKK